MEEDLNFKQLSSALSITFFASQLRPDFHGIALAFPFKSLLKVTACSDNLISYRIQLQPCANDYVHDVTVIFHT